MDIKKALIVLVAVAAAITLIEAVNLTKISLWHDEAFSALLVEYDFSEMMARIKLDVHPPLYYIILKGWTDIFSNSLFSLRMFSIFFAFLAIIAVYLFTKKAFKNTPLALVTGLFYSLSYFQIQYAMEARMYSLGSFLVALSGYLLLTALEKRKILWWISYAISIAAGIYVHYFVAFWVISQAIYLVYVFYKESGLKIGAWLGNKNFQLAVFAYCLVFLSYIPWLPTFLKQFNQVQETFWIPPMTIWSIPNTFLKMTVGSMADAERYWILLFLLTALTAAAVAFFLRKTGAKEKWLFFLQLFFPFVITALLSYKRSIYIDRYFIFGFPSYLLIIAGAVWAIKQKTIKISLVLAMLISIATTFPIQWNILNVEKKPGMAAAAEYVNENAKPGEKIFVGSSLIYFTFRYYNKTGIPAKLYAPGQLTHFSGTALLTKEDVIADFSIEAGKNDVVWMLNTTGFGNYQPAVPPNWLKEQEKGFEEVNAYQGWTIVSKYRIN